MIFIDAAEIRARLTYERCIPLMREAMAAFSRGETLQPLRSVVRLGEGRLFGVMPGALGERGLFGAKLVSVFHENAARGGPSHQGVVVLFDGENGAPVCIADGGEVTAIRTAAASAAATDALARPDATRLAILGTGLQALTHARAIARVRPLSGIAIWGRSAAKAEALAAAVSAELGVAARAADSAEAAAAEADIICTVTASTEPVLLSAFVKAGTHINLVGSSVAGPVEADAALVTRARFIADSKPGVLAQGAEFLKAKEAGLIGDDHIAGEIGAVFDGRLEGRQSEEQVTIYKSLGHVVQDLAAAGALYRER